MSGKNAKRKNTTAVPDPVQPKGLFPFSDFRTQALILSLIGLIFYFNSFFNEFALDDGIVIIKNEYVQQGVGGLGKIFTKDAYDSFYRSMNAKDQLSGGRYRPLSIATFALEQEVIGLNPTDPKAVQDPARGMHLRHVVNVCLYIISVLVLLQLLRTTIFSSNTDIAFITALLFLIHPIHTEVVANVKSRDEIMSLLFIGLTFMSALRYLNTNRIKDLILGLAYFFLALLSKEYAITLLFLLPLSFYLFGKKTPLSSISATLPYIGVLAIYFLIRFSIVVFHADVVDNEVLNNPYLFATPAQKLATEISTTLNYFKLLLFPHPLSADYSYNSIPYKDFTHPLVFLSLLVHLGMVFAFFKLLQKRHPLAFAVAFYLANLAMVCNIFLNIGATMGERLIYHSSLGFAMCLAYLLVWASDKFFQNLNLRKGIVYFCLGFFVFFGAGKTIARNAEWKNDITLFTKDVETVPESILANGNAGARYIDLANMPSNAGQKEQLLDKAIGYLDKGIALHPRYVTSYVNRGLAYYLKGDLEKTKENWDKVALYYPHYPEIPRYKAVLTEAYLRKGFNYGKSGDVPKALVEILKAKDVDSTNAEVYYHLGGAYYTLQQFLEAQKAWAKALELKPDYKEARTGYDVVTQQLKAFPFQQQVQLNKQSTIQANKQLKNQQNSSQGIKPNNHP